MKYLSCFLCMFILWVSASRTLADPPQLRGIWMHATQIKTPTEADSMVTRIDRANLNAVFLLVWYWGGQAYYHSDLCPMGEGIQDGYDPLGYMVRQCHRRGIEVHAWFVNGAYGASQPRHVLDEHPDWAVDNGGAGQIWYDFGKPEVREFQSDLMIECLEKYDIDGLHFDYIRYGPHVCFCDHCQKEFARRYGFEPVTEEQRGTFPVFAEISANTLKHPTTATVLAEFAEDNIPAIALNEHGEGQVLMLNWHAESDMPAAAAESVKRFLKSWTSEGQRVFITNTPANRRQYGERFVAKASSMLRRLGYAPDNIQAESVERLAIGSVVVLPAVYIIPESTAEKLESFVRSGGRLLIIDGPVRSMGIPAMQRITGFAGSGPYIHRDGIIRSTGRSSFVPKGKHKLNLKRHKLRAAKWAEFRKAGVTSLVRDVYRRSKESKPRAQITAAVFTPLESADAVYQDWPGWLREGCIDYVIPMAYTTDTQGLREQIEEWRTVDSELSRIIPGLSIYEREDGTATSRDPGLIRDQVELIRRYTSHGNLFFSLHYLDERLIKLCRNELYPTRVRPYRPAPEQPHPGNHSQSAK